MYGEEQIQFLKNKNYLVEGESLGDRINDFHKTVKKYEAKYSEGLADRIKDLIERQILSPSTPQWSNFGRETKGDTTPLPVSCNIINYPNSISGIYYSHGEAAMLSKLGAGVGANFDNLCEKGTKIDEGFYTNPKLDWIEDFVGTTQKVSQGCYDDKTEILTNKGWVFFKDLRDLKEVKVAQVMDNETVEFVKPEAYFEYDVKENLLHFKDSKNIDLLVTKNHNMVYKQEKRIIKDGTYKRFVKDKFYVKTADICPTHRDVKYLHAGVSKNGRGVSMKERLLIALQADGSITKRCNKAIRFRFSKVRKRDRIVWILNTLGFEFSENFYEKDNTYNIYVNVGEVLPKTFDWVSVENVSQQWCEEFLEEVSFWDGSLKGKGFEYSSVIKSNVDVVQQICAVSGYKSNIKNVGRKKEHHSDRYNITVSKGTYFGVEKLIKEEVYYEGKVYCVEVPTHRLVVRRNGKTVVCGNSQRRGYGVPFISIEDKEFYDIIDRVSKENSNKHDTLVDNNIGILLPKGFRDKIRNGDKEAQKRFLTVLQERKDTGKIYIVDEDNLNKNQSDVYSKLGHVVNSTNICVEACTPSYDDKTFACVLASLNLKHWDIIKKNPQIIKDAVMFLDIVVEEYIRLTEGIPFLDKVRKSSIEKRDIGLGTLGFHELLQMNNMAFGDLRSRALNKEIYKTIRKYADEASEEMANKLGAPLMCREAGINKRNVSLMMCAPNKSTSFICGNTTPGIEPNKSNVFVKALAGIQTSVKNKYLVSKLESIGKNNQEVWDSIIDNLGSVQHLDFLDQQTKDVFRTASEISPKEIIDLASDRQKYIDMSQSLNLFSRPNYTLKDIYDIHMYAFDKDIKTLYYFYPQSHSANEVEGEKWDTCVSCQD